MDRSPLGEFKGDACGVLAIGNRELMVGQTGAASHSTSLSSLAGTPMVRVAVLLSPGATAPAGRHPTGLAGHLGEGRGPGRIGHAVGLVTLRPFEEPLERPGGIVDALMSVAVRGHVTGRISHGEVIGLDDVKVSP